MKAWKYIIIGVTAASYLYTSAVHAIPAVYNSSSIIDDGDFTQLPSYFQNRTRQSGIALIQLLLETTQSALGKAENNKSNDESDINKDFSQVLIDLNPISSWENNRPWLLPYNNTKMRFSEMLWEQTLGTMRKTRWYEAESNALINPLFTLAFIQKESGLIYGNGAKYGRPNVRQSISFRYNRMMGYGCTDSSGSDCQAPGAFYQIHIAHAFLKRRFELCGQNGASIAAPRIGETISDGTGWSATVGTVFACTGYRYTPHSHETFYYTIQEIDTMLQKLAPLVPADLGTAPAASIPPAESPKPAQPPVQVVVPESNFTSMTFTFNNSEEVKQEVKVQAPEQKPPPPIPTPPPYVPKYVEPESAESRSPEALSEFMANFTIQHRSENSSTIAQVQGVREERKPWYYTPVFVYTTTIVTLTTVSLISYGIITKLYKKKYTDSSQLKKNLKK